MSLCFGEGREGKGNEIGQGPLPIVPGRDLLVREVDPAGPQHVGIFHRPPVGLQRLAAGLRCTGQTFPGRRLALSRFPFLLLVRLDSREPIILGGMDRTFGLDALDLRDALRDSILAGGKSRPATAP